MLQPLKVIQDALPKELAISAREEFKQADYDRITQERRGYYGREFLDQIPFVP